MIDFTIGIPIYNKSHMIHKIIDGLVENLKEECKFIFILDGCTDNSEEILNANVSKLSGEIEILKTDNIHQLRTNNITMRKLITEFLIIFQDDMVLIDPNFLNNIRKIKSIYGDNLGIIGCRDGFEKSYIQMESAEHSGSDSLIVNRLKSGEFKEKSMINIGPIIFTKQLIDKVGIFDETYEVCAYEEVDYSLNCKHNYGLTNIVLGVDLIHSKFEELVIGERKHTSNSVLEEYLNKNLFIFRSRWFNHAGI